MSQNLISLTLTDAQLAAVDAALEALEANFGNLLSLEASERRGLTKMGDKSEAFCRQTLMALVQNPQVVPGSLDLAEANQDLRTLDQLRPRLARLQRLGERASDTEMALGSDVMTASLMGYGLLKIAGKHQGLESLRKALSYRFKGGARSEPSGAQPG